MKKFFLKLIAACLVLFYAREGKWHLMDKLAPSFYVAGTAPYFIWIALMAVTTILLASVYFLIFDRQFFRRFSFKPIYLVYLVLGFVAYLLTNVLANFIAFSGVNQANIDDLLQSTPDNALIYFLLNACLLGPIEEEFVYRGLVMTVFKDSKWYLDVLLSAFLFGYVHVMSVFTIYPLAILPYFIDGLVQAILYRKTKSIYYPLMLHIGINLYASRSLIIYLLGILM